MRQKYKKDRIDFALKHLSERMDWRSVFFSDEKKFNFHGPDGNRKVWVKEAENNENLILYRRQQGGGSVMCWVGFCNSVKGLLFFF